MDTLTITIGVSILIYVVIGSYAGRSIKKLDDYFVAGRRAPTILILGTLVASVMSTSIFMGEAAFTYDGQFGAYLLFPGIAVTGYMLGALFLASICGAAVHLPWQTFLGVAFTAAVCNSLPGSRSSSAWAATC